MKTKFMCSAGRTTLLFCIFLFFSCGSASDSKNGSGPISDEWQAESIAKCVNTACSQVRSNLPADFESSYTHTLSDNFYTNPNGGSCIVTGTTHRTYSVSGSSVSDTLDIDITIIFTDWNTNSGDIPRKLNGVITYSDHSTSYSTSSSYSSSLSKSISGSGINIIDLVENIEDIFSLNVTDYDNNDFMVTGWVSGTNGTFYF